MSKKNKDIEVMVKESQEDVAGTSQEVLTLWVGKKEIGRLRGAEKGYTVFYPEGNEANVKTQEEGFDALIRNWNLHE